MKWSLVGVLCLTVMVGFALLFIQVEDPDITATGSGETSVESAIQPKVQNTSSSLLGQGLELEQELKQELKQETVPSLDFGSLKKDRPVQSGVDARLLHLLDQLALKGVTRESATRQSPASLTTPFVQLDRVGRVQVYVDLELLDASVLADLASFEFEQELANETLGIVQGWLPFDQIKAVASIAGVKRVYPPVYSQVQQGSVETEGDGILGADQLRALGLDGTGIRIGVISDGANAREMSVSSGDLPAGIVQYGICTERSFDGINCDPGRTCNEGTAMMEIIHDMAPGAELAMGAINTSLEFIQRVDDLANDFGADIIVDDIGFLSEPFFADGAVAQAMDALTSEVVFISSAGNSAGGHYEGTFTERLVLEDSLHDFGATASGVNDHTLDLSIAPGRYLVAFLQWNDVFGQSGNDYDLFLTNAAETDVLCPFCASVGFQEGAGDPLEAVCYFNDTSQSVQARLVVLRALGTPRVLEMLMFGAGSSAILQYNVPTGSVFGHAAVPDVVAVGAIDAADPGNNTIEFFSSLGPARIDFPSLQFRAKPDVVGIDGVSVTGNGGFPNRFYGTSAAAPHVAGLAALLLQADPSATPSDLRDTLTGGAVDLGLPGYDMTYGHGRVDGLNSVALVDNDADADGVLLTADNCPSVANPLQANNDSDSQGDVCDDDDDNDLLPDEWEILNGLDPFNPADAAQDPDQDGSSNLDEFLAGTNPFDQISGPLLDVDGNGEVGALTDCLLILRYVFGFRGETLVEDAVDPDCVRCSGVEIASYLDTLL